MRGIWSVRPREPKTPLLPFILQERGHASPEETAAYLSPSLLEMHDPFLFKDMRLAVDRLLEARRSGEKILIHGDYDADGVTGTALLYLALTRWDFSVIVHIPERSDGYGLQAEMVRQAADKGTSLIVTVDCGVTAVEAAVAAKSLGVDIIVTDHHEPGEVLPEVVALLNPKTDDGYPFGALAGVGVAFKLIQAVAQELGVQAETRRFLDIVALGTIADIVPLVGENRVIVTHGLRQMAETVHVGLRALLDECGFAEKKPQAGHVAFMVAPRINAAGRMDTCRLALNLFLTQDLAEARAFAHELTRENLNRQNTEKEILAEAHAQLAQGELPRAIVLSSPQWRHGVIGIVASRLVEFYHRPSYLIAEEGVMAKGSARGIVGYHVLEELTQQKDCLTAFGGHVYAAGFSLRVEDIGHLRMGLNQALSDAEPDLFLPRIKVEAILSLGEVDLRLLQALAHLAPYGAGNPSPVFGFRGVRVISVQRMGKEGIHLKLKVAEGDSPRITPFEVMAFNRGGEESALCAAERIDLVASLEINHYRGLESVQILLKDWAESQEARWEELPRVAKSPVDQKPQQRCQPNQTRQSDQACQGDQAPPLCPLDRQRVAAVYKALRQEFQKSQKSQESQEFQESQESQESPSGSNVSFIWEDTTPEDRECVKILEELELITCLGGTGPWTLSLEKKPQKRDLTSSFRYNINSRGLIEV